MTRAGFALSWTNWIHVKDKLIEDVRRSERLTATDLATRINT